MLWANIRSVHEGTVYHRCEEIDSYIQVSARKPNFLHFLNFRVYEIEKQINAPEKFRFPHYESVCWYAASRIVVELRDMAAAGTRVPPIMITGARCLLVALRQWGGEVRLT